MIIDKKVIDEFEEHATAARKRRIQLLRGDSSASSQGDANERKNEEKVAQQRPLLSSIRGIKKQTRYEPEIPMSKAELSLWRKEARRVRNRESAAASRQKIRGRIEELEEQLATLDSKYQAALKRIEELESIERNTATETTTTPQSNPPKESSTKNSAVPNSVSPLLSASQPCVTPSDPDFLIMTELAAHDTTKQWSPTHQQAAQELAQSIIIDNEDENSSRSSNHPTNEMHNRPGTIPSSKPLSGLLHLQNLRISRPTAV
jgi:hypothetical protein